MSQVQVLIEVGWKHRQPEDAIELVLVRKPAALDRIGSLTGCEDPKQCRNGHHA